MSFDNQPVNFDRMLSNVYDCSLDFQYNKKDKGLYYIIDVPITNNEEEYNSIYQKLQFLSPLQRQFFLEPASSTQKSYVFCPGGSLESFYFPQNSETKSHYEDINQCDKLLILKWCFSIICAVKTLIEYGFEYFNIFHENIFIDSKMEARYFYSNWLSNGNPTLTQDKDFYKAPRKVTINGVEVQNNVDLEKDCVYSIGILLNTLLNRCQPSKYFPNYSSSEKEELIVKKKIFQNKIPECKLKPIIMKSLEVYYKDRPTLNEVISFLLDPKNCLEDVNYSEFRKFVNGKFGVDEKVDHLKLVEIINDKLSTKYKLQQSEIKYEKFTLKNMDDFLNLARKASSYCDIIQNNFDISFQKLETSVNLIKGLDTLYKKFLNDKNKYILGEKFFVNNTEQYLNQITSNKMDLFTLNDMADDESMSSSFMLRVYPYQMSANFVIPEKFGFDEDCLKIMNASESFVHPFNFKNVQMFEYYPYSNIYNILNNNSYANEIGIKSKVTWVYQTAVALKKLHESNYTILHFSSKNVFIDSDFNAHLLPVKMIKITNKFDSEISNESNFTLSHLAPELLNVDDDEILFSKHTEKSVVFNFGVFISELIFNYSFECLFENLNDSEKVELLKRNRKINIEREYDIKEQNYMVEIANMCLERDQLKRKNFDEVIEQMNTFIDEEIKAKEEKVNKEEVLGSEKEQKEEVFDSEKAKEKEDLDSEKAKKEEVSESEKVNNEEILDSKKAKKEEVSDSEKVNNEEILDSEKAKKKEVLYLEKMKKEEILASKKVEEDEVFNSEKVDLLDSQKVIQESINAGSILSNLIIDHLYNLLDLDMKITYTSYLDQYKESINKFGLICSILVSKDIDICDILNQANTISIFEGEQESDTEIENVDDSDYCLQGYADDIIRIVKTKQFKIWNKPELRYCHMGGLKKRGANQYLLRYAKNSDFKYRQYIELVVKNKYFYPYADDLKMVDVKSKAQELASLNIFKSNMRVFKNPKGNGDEILDMKIDIESM